MGCFLALFALISPRLALFVLWLFTGVLDEPTRQLPLEWAHVTAALLRILVKGVGEGGAKRTIRHARVTQVADKSDKARDTAKIAGGAAAGGVVGHQISHKNGAIIGAIIGAAAGTAAAKKTGQEVVLPAGTVVGLTLDSPVTVTM